MFISFPADSFFIYRHRRQSGRFFHMLPFINLSPLGAIFCYNVSTLQAACQLPYPHAFFQCFSSFLQNEFPIYTPTCYGNSHSETRLSTSLLFLVLLCFSAPLDNNNHRKLAIPTAFPSICPIFS